MTTYRSGFVTFIGRPNAGKSSIINRIIGQKVSIVSNKVQTTRTQIRGVYTQDNKQIIFVDTPGIHKPRSSFGQHLNDQAVNAVPGVDLVCFIFDATKPIGAGDRFILEKLDPKNSIVVLNKIDNATPSQILKQLQAISSIFPACDFFPVSARTGKGIDTLVTYLLDHLPEGPQYYSGETIHDVPESFWVSELVREQLLRITKEELPHSVTTRVTEWEWPRVRVEILVQRESQKGIVIGKNGAILKEVGTAVRSQLASEMFLELFVKVDSKWQQRPESLLPYHES